MSKRMARLDGEPPTRLAPDRRWAGSSHCSLSLWLPPYTLTPKQDWQDQGSSILEKGWKTKNGELDLEVSLKK